MVTSETRIEILLPLPLNVVGALSAAIGAMWPEAMIRTDTSNFTIVVPDRQPKRPSRKRLRDILAETAPAAEDPSAVLLGLNPDGGARIGLDQADEAWQHLAVWAYTVLTAFEATNYVEQTVRTELPDGTAATLALEACWSKGQTPHQLRQKAEAERDRVQLELDRLRARLGDHGLAGNHRIGHRLDTADAVAAQRPGTVLRDRHGDCWQVEYASGAVIELAGLNGRRETTNTAMVRRLGPFTILAGPHQPPTKEN